MSYLHEFGAEYDPPRVITTAEGIEDHSWHNDTCPSFGRCVEGATGDSHDVRIWCDHPDPDQRENAGGRFIVTYQPWMNEPAPDLAEFADGAPIYEGDDATEALAAFMVTLGRVHQFVRGGGSA